jgi:hypothetical protein
MWSRRVLISPRLAGGGFAATRSRFAGALRCSPPTRRARGGTPQQSSLYLSVFLPPCITVMSLTALVSVLASRANEVSIMSGLIRWRVIALE